MPKCPNCGRETLRTEDWACQWCGHPLLSGAYKKIDKTYRELQEERTFDARSVLKEEVPETAQSVPQPPPPPAPALKPPPPVRIEPESEVLSPPEPAVEVEVEPEEESQTRPEPELEPDPVAESGPVAEEVKLPVTEPDLEPVAETAAEAEPEVKATQAPPPVAVPALEPDPATGVVSTTVEELNAAFNSDKEGSNNKLINKPLKVTGTVDKVFAKDHLDIFYILLTAGKPATWQVRCTFSREEGAHLSRLTEGQTGTVQGTYIGYERNIILKDCRLVQ